MIRRIIEDPKLHAEAKTAALHMDRMQQPGERQELYAALQPLLVMYKLPEFGGDGDAAKAAYKAWLKLFMDALADLPLAAVRLGVDDYVKTSRFTNFPAPGSIRELAEPHAVRIRVAAYRLKRAAEAQERPDPKAVTPEERAAMKAQAAELTEILKNGPRKPPEPPRRPRGLVAEEFRRVGQTLDAWRDGRLRAAPHPSEDY